MLFPELGTEGALPAAPRGAGAGSIVGQDGTVCAEHARRRRAGLSAGVARRPDHRLCHPGDTARMCDTPSAWGSERGDVVGRSGLEQGAEALLARHAGLRPAGGPRRGRSGGACSGREMVPGADVTITIRPDIQAAADARHRRLREAGTAVIDPRSGDVWALAIGPALQPERDDHRHHPGGHPAAPRRRTPRGSTRRSWPPTRPARRSSPSRWSPR